jgi:hypothetical protein
LGRRARLTSSDAVTASSSGSKLKPAQVNLSDAQKYFCHASQLTGGQFHVVRSIDDVISLGLQIVVRPGNRLSFAAVHRETAKEASHGYS